LRCLDFCKIDSLLKRIDLFLIIQEIMKVVLFLLPNVY
jgi:hypothetical protein